MGLTPNDNEFLEAQYKDAYLLLKTARRIAKRRKTGTTKQGILERARAIFVTYETRLRAAGYTEEKIKALLKEADDKDVSSR